MISDLAVLMGSVTLLVSVAYHVLVPLSVALSVHRQFKTVHRVSLLPTRRYVMM